MGRARRRDRKAFYMIRTGVGSGGASRYVSKKTSPPHQVFNGTKRIGPASLSNAALFRACRNRHKPWSKVPKYFVRFFKRAKHGRIPGVRTQADVCRLIGCSITWARMIMNGTAADSNKHKANRTDHLRGSGTAKAKSDPDYANDITRYAQHELQLLMIQDPQRFREICRLLASSFSEAARRIET
jgi:hypothetical protein